MAIMIVAFDVDAVFRSRTELAGDVGAWRFVDAEASRNLIRSDWSVWTHLSAESTTALLTMSLYPNPSDKTPGTEIPNRISGALQGVLSVLSVSDTGDNLQMRITSSLSRDFFNHRHDATPDSGWEKRPHVDQLSKLGVADYGCNITCAAFCAT